MRIEPATSNDLAEIRAAYEHGRTTQRAQGSTQWPDFSDSSILAEIDAGQLYRVIDGGELAGIFSVAYEDPAIWGSLEVGDHIYLHRIARAPAWHRRGLVDAILAWADAQCEALGRSGVRIDTWAENTPLIAFYESRGFRVVARTTVGTDPRLAPHYHGNTFALLERAQTSASRSSQSTEAISHRPPSRQS